MTMTMTMNLTGPAHIYAIINGNRVRIGNVARLDVSSVSTRHTSGGVVIAPDEVATSITIDGDIEAFNHPDFRRFQVTCNPGATNWPYGDTAYGVVVGRGEVRIDGDVYDDMAQFRRQHPGYAIHIIDV